MSPIGSSPGREDDILRKEAAKRLSLSIVNSYPPRDQDTLRIVWRQLLFVLVRCYNQYTSLSKGNRRRHRPGRISDFGFDISSP
jgi:hypothetical protein